MLRGEVGEVLHHSGEQRTACEMCRMRALRGGWRRDPVEELPAARARQSERGRLLGRLRGRGTAAAPVETARVAPQRVKAEPTGSAGRARAAIEHFNASPHRGTITSVGNSLGEPIVTLLEVSEEEYDIVAAWDLCWYRWRVETGQGGATVVEAGRGFEKSELERDEISGGVATAADGTLTWLA